MSQENDKVPQKWQSNSQLTNVSWEVIKFLKSDKCLRKSDKVPQSCEKVPQDKVIIEYETMDSPNLDVFLEIFQAALGPPKLYCVFSDFFGQNLQYFFGLYKVSH